jgi:hypothetical protein
LVGSVLLWRIDWNWLEVDELHSAALNISIDH